MDVIWDTAAALCLAQGHRVINSYENSYRQAEGVWTGGEISTFHFRSALWFHSELNHCMRTEALGEGVSTIIISYSALDKWFKFKLPYSCSKRLSKPVGPCLAEQLSISKKGQKVPLKYSVVLAIFKWYYSFINVLNLCWFYFFFVFSHLCFCANLALTHFYYFIL